MGAYLEMIQTVNALGVIAMILIGSSWLKKTLRGTCCSR